MMALIQTIILLCFSNTFMLFAWYGNLKNGLNHKPLIIIILVSWCIALLEYCFMIPANRIGFNSAQLQLAQLKILQEVISLALFMPFAILYMKQAISINFLWAGCCLIGAVYFIFK